MGGAGTDADSSQAGPQVDSPELCHLTRRVTSELLVIVPEPSIGVPTPALDGAVVEYDARVRCAGGERDGSFGATEIHRAQVVHVAYTAAALAAVVRIVVPKLPGGADAPALYAAVLEDRARVVATGIRGDGGPACADVDRLQVCHGIRVFVAFVHFAVLTENPVCAIAPAFDRALVEQGARVTDACTDAEGGQASAEVDVPEDCHLAHRVAQALRAVVPETPVCAVPPAFHVAGVEYGARVR